MSSEQIEGMQSRADGKLRADNPYDLTAPRCEWYTGFDLMNAHIQRVIDAAKSMMEGIEEVRRNRHPTLVRAMAGSDRGV